VEALFSEWIEKQPDDDGVLRYELSAILAILRRVTLATTPAPLDEKRQYGPCATRLDNQPTPSARPWRYGHAASIEGAHWDIYAGQGIDGWLVGMVTTEADAALIVELVNRVTLAATPAPLDVPLTKYQRGYLDGREASRIEAATPATALREAAIAAVRDAGTDRWPVNLDRLRMALDDLGLLAATEETR
jgi:hypothetical protein